MINLADFGELISKQEWDLVDDEIVTFAYVGKNKNYAEDNFIFVGGDKRENGGFDCRVEVAEKNYEVEFSTTFIETLNQILSVADNVGKLSTPVLALNYENAKVKDKDFFEIKITDAETFCIPKENTFMVDKKYFAEEMDENFKKVLQYEFHDYGIYSVDNEGIKMYLLNDDITSNLSYDSAELRKLLEIPGLSTKVPNLHNLSSTIKFFVEDNLFPHYVDCELIYDEYGLVKDAHGLIENDDHFAHCLYESYSFDEYDYPVYVTSLHEFFYDNFDTGILPSAKRFCVEAIDRGLDERALIYSREIYEVNDEEKLKELIELINEAREKSEPIIPVID